MREQSITELLLRIMALLLLLPMLFAVFIIAIPIALIEIYYILKKEWI